MTAKQIHIALARLGDPDIAAHSMRFFKSGKGEYGVGGRSFFKEALQRHAAYDAALCH